MKLISVILFMFAVCFLHAQVEETSLPMSDGDNPAFSVILPKDSGEKDVERLWSKYMRSYKTKVRKKDGEIIFDNADIPEISENSVDIYASVYESSTDVQLIAWFDLGGAYLSSESHPEEAGIIKSMLQDFHGEVEIDIIKQALKLEEKTLKDLQNELKGLTNKRENLDGAIARYEQKIREAKSDIDMVEAQKESVLKKISEQEGQVTKVTEELLTKQ